MLLRIVNAGVTSTMPEYLARRVIISNILSLVIGLGLALPFVLISVLLFPALTWLPVSAVVLCLILPFMNQMGGYQGSRIIITLVPIALAGIYNAGLVPAGAGPVLGIYLIQLSFTAIPFIAFDLREPSYLFGSFALCLAILLLFPQTNALYETNIDASLLQEGWLQTTVVAMAVFMNGISVYFLARTSLNTEKKLLHKIDEEEQMLEESQDREENMKRQMGELEEARRQEKRRQYVGEGMEQLSRILRKGTHAETMLKSFLAETVEYLNAQQGGLFMAHFPENEPAYLQMVATYAHHREKYMKKRFAPGEGLVGQCFREADMLYITEIPAQFPDIKSGLGAAPPAAILLVPLIFEDYVEGVLELALFREVRPEQKELLARVAESVAITLHNNRMSQRTNQLLALAQEREASLKAQEEEIQQREAAYQERISWLETNLAKYTAH